PRPRWPPAERSTSSGPRGSYRRGGAGARYRSQQGSAVSARISLVAGESALDHGNDADGETAGAEVDAEALDACSRTVADVVERLAPSVATLRVLRATRRGRTPAGAG